MKILTRSWYGESVKIFKQDFIWHWYLQVWHTTCFNSMWKFRLFLWPFFWKVVQFLFTPVHCLNYCVRPQDYAADTFQPVLLRSYCHIFTDITVVWVMPNTCNCDSSVYAEARVSSSQQLLDSVTWHRVEKQQQHDCQGQHSQNFEDGPLVVVPHNVPDWLQWVQEPHEGCIRSTGEHYKIIHMHSHKVSENKVLWSMFGKRE